MKDFDYKNAYLKLYSHIQEIFRLVTIDGNNISECKIKIYVDEAIPPSSALDAKIVVAVANGCTNFEIGSMLECSHRTVEAHLMRLRRKYGATNTYQLIAVFFRNGWIK